MSQNEPNATRASMQFECGHLATRTPLARRTFLRTSGAAALSLPLLEAIEPTLGKRTLHASEAAHALQPPKRFVAMCATLGFHTPFLFPEKEGPLAPSTRYLKQLEEHLDQLTLFSGVSHPEQQGNNGHASELTWLTSAKRPGLAGFRNSVSIDQLIAQEIGINTRFPFLALSTSGRSLSWTANGVEIPGMTSPEKLFQALFLEGTAAEVEDELAAIRRGRSILDTVGARSEELAKRLSKPDQAKIDEYLTAVRALEVRLQQSQDWVNKPKPKVLVDSPKDENDRNQAIQRQRLLFDMVVLALQTDSTRTVTVQLSGLNSVPVVPGVSSDWHGLSHHGKDPQKIEELALIEQAEFAVLAEFLNGLRNVQEGSRSLLDQTAVLYGSNLGNASSHDWRNLPLILAGGGYRHGYYVAHDEKENTPMANLLLEMAVRMGLEQDRFGSSTATGLRGLQRQDI